MSREYFAQYPGRRDFAASIDLGSALVVATKNLPCYIAKIGGVLEAVVYRCPKGHLYVRVLDFTLDSPAFTKDEAVRASAVRQVMRGKDPEGVNVGIMVRSDIVNYVIMLRRDDKATAGIRKLAERFSIEVGDVSVPSSVVMEQKKGAAACPRVNHRFIAIEFLPHLLSQFGIYDNPPDPAWEPVWQIIRRMELLGGCSLAEPRPRNGTGNRRKIAVQPAVAPEAPPLITDEQTALAEDVRKDEDFDDDENTSFMQLRRPEMAAKYRIAVKIIKDLREREKQRLSTSAHEEVCAARMLAAQYKYKLKEALAVDSQERSKLVLAEREITELKRIIDALDLDSKPIPIESRKIVHSYKRLYEGLSPELIVHQAVKREYILSQALTAARAAKAEVCRLKELISPPVSVEVEVQTSDSWQEILALHMQLDKSRVQHTPSVRGRDAEDRLLDLLVGMAPTNSSVLLTRSVGHCGDYLVIYRDQGDETISGYAIIDCKCYTSTVPGKQVDKLIDDIEKTRSQFKMAPRWAAIVSMESDVIHNGKSGASDFWHESTIPVFLMHSTHKRGDDGSSSIRDLLGKASFIQQKAEETKISDESSQLLKVFETALIQGKRQGRGRTHSQVRSKVSFKTEISTSSPGISAAMSQPTARVAPVVPEPESDDDMSQDLEGVEENVEAVKRAGQRSKGAPAPHVPLDPRIFIAETEISPAHLKIAIVMSRLCKYDAGHKIKGVDIGSKVSSMLNITPNAVQKALRLILAKDVRCNRWLMNLTLTE